MFDFADLIHHLKQIINTLQPAAACRTLHFKSLTKRWILSNETQANISRANMIYAMPAAPELPWSSPHVSRLKSCVVSWFSKTCLQPVPSFFTFQAVSIAPPDSMQYVSVSSTGETSTPAGKMKLSRSLVASELVEIICEMHCSCRKAANKYNYQFCFLHVLCACVFAFVFVCLFCLSADRPAAFFCILLFVVFIFLCCRIQNKSMESSPAFMLVLCYHLLNDLWHLQLVW